MQAIRRILPYLKPYWKEILLSLVALSLGVVADLMLPMQIALIIDDGIAQNDMTVVYTRTLLMVGIALLSVVLAFVNTIFASRVTETFAADLRGKAYNQIQSFSFGNLDRLHTAELLVRLTSDVNIVKNALMMTMRMAFRAPLMLIGSLLMLLIVSPSLSLTLLVLLPLTIGLILWFSLKTEPMYKNVQARLDRLNRVLQENIAGVRVVKAFVRADHEIGRFGRANDAYATQSIQVNQLVAILMPTMIVLMNLGLTAIVWAGGWLTINDTIQTGELVAFTNYLMTTMIPVLMLGMILPQLFASEASIGRVLEVIDTRAAVVDRPDAPPLLIRRGTVVFEDVALSYYQHDREDAFHKPVLEDINFTAEPGQTVALLGSTGSGKTSLVSLLPRFYDVTDGRILIDGVDVRDVTQESLRAQMGYALQEAVLFSGTVRDNIRYGRPDATDEDVIAAAKAAQAHEFIMRKPQGYDTIVGQRGANFSGGQKQRLAIARALCVQPKILILDDSTSAVDVETEAKIQAALEQIMARKLSTTFVVAQRISTVLNADKILVLENGRVTAEGIHDELILSSPVYQEIYHSQLGNGNSLSEPNGHREVSHA